jgi:hypothetical protein
MTMNTTTETARKILLNALMETSPRPGKELDALVKAGGCSHGQLSGACRDLKLWGLMYQPGRGMYAITEAGRAVAEGGPLPAISKDAEASEEASTMARSEEAAPETVESDPAPVAEPAAPAKRRLKVANAPVTPVTPATPVEVPSWLDDADIRALAVEATECFGAWSARSTECGKCPLAGWCRNAKASTLSLLATKLQTGNPANPEPVKASVAKLDEAVGAANAPGAPRTAPPDGLVGLAMKARHDGVCAVSGRAIKAGDAIKYLTGFGVYHADETPPATAK